MRVDPSTIQTCTVTLPNFEQANRELNTPYNNINGSIFVKTRQSLINSISIGLRNKEKNTDAISVTDDIGEKSRADHKALIPKTKSMREKGYLCYIPFDTPRGIMCKKKGTSDKYKLMEDDEFLDL